MKHLEYRTDYYKSDLGYGTEELPFKLSQGCFLKSPIYRGILERNKVIRWFHEYCFYVGGK